MKTKTKKEVKTKKELITDPLEPQDLRAPLRIAPEVWAQLHYYQQTREVEISGFGLSKPDDPKAIIEFALLKQTGSAGGTLLDDIAISDHAAQCYERGFEPKDCLRIWIHTHPRSMDPTPSATDWNCVSRIFSDCDYGYMLIVGKDMTMSCTLLLPVHNRLQYLVLPEPQVAFNLSIHVNEWRDQYNTNVTQDSLWTPQSERHITTVTKRHRDWNELTNEEQNNLIMFWELDADTWNELSVEDQIWALSNVTQRENYDYDYEYLAADDAYYV